ncbi:MAG: hypothetical protein SFV54_08055 [Bryobacteraceae bacterium]|nr:hypothetical protein [Bryobacteraceae bacterium]
MRCLLMGGQACVWYGAAEFSRDLDLVLLLDEGNLERLRGALRELDAERVAVPEFAAEWLERGHAVHFRCRREDVAGLRIDVMSRMRGVDSFEELWKRRTTLEEGGEVVDLLSLPDLVRAKKTQRDKDWPMIRRLVERSYLSAVDAGAAAVRFWLAELRSAELLVEAVGRFPEEAAGSSRAAVAAARQGDIAGVEAALESEQRAEREADRRYWAPLVQELERLRRGRKH